MSHIFLIGMPYSGKTTLGSQLAVELGIKFVDLDLEIEKLAGKSIPRIFEDEGEEYFRTLESDTLTRVLGSLTSPAIISLGGGTPCFNNNINLIKSNGISVFLDVELSELIKRSQDDDSRPLLKENKNAAIKNMFNKRRSCYMKSDRIVSGNNIGIDDIKELIKS